MKKKAQAARVVLITGATRGIGRALAERFASNGDIVLANYAAGDDAARDTADAIRRSGGICVPVKADVSDPVKVSEMINGILDTRQRLDIVVNNAGTISRSLVAVSGDDEWDRVLNTNLKGPFNIIRACSRAMMKQKSGSIINISSIAGISGSHGAAGYAASKGGLISLTKTSAKELGRFGVCVNAVLPGFHLTDMGKASTERYISQAIGSSVLGAATSMDELADFVLLLSGARTVSGQVFNWDSRII